MPRFQSPCRALGASALVLAIWQPAIAAERSTNAPDVGRPNRTIAVGEFAACAITSAKQVACWGQGSDSPDTPADVVRSRSPRTIAHIQGAVQIALLYRYACALDGKGRVTCWGIIDSSSPDVVGKAPAPIPGLKDVVQIGVGWYEACALTRTGEVWCWGTEAGLGHRPALVKQAVGQISLGDEALCVLLRDGSIECSGSAPSGAFGPPLTDFRKVESLGPATDVIAGAGFACGLSASGAVSCAGAKAEAILKGLAKRTIVRRLWVSPSSDFSCDLDDAGKLRCWGRSYAGQLGDGQVLDEPRGPVEPQIPGDVVEVALGSAAACARTRTHGVFCWGSNAGWVAAPSRTGHIQSNPTEIKLP